NSRIQELYHAFACPIFVLLVAAFVQYAPGLYGFMSRIDSPSKYNFSVRRPNLRFRQFFASCGVMTVNALM
ncbi:MAG: hypothetical protein O3A08_14765, partial [Proteobacteria bacterium]|nr:hypothetical protein [Pseudomonadota bacterium]